MSGRLYKSVARTGTVESIVDAYSMLEELHDEVQEIVDNATDGLRETSRIQTFEETASTLDNASSPPDVPECVSDLAISYSESVHRSKRAGPSRAVRCENACAIIGAAIQACQDYLAEGECNEDDQGEVESFISELEDMQSNAESAEFPGMFG